MIPVMDGVTEVTTGSGRLWSPRPVPSRRDGFGERWDEELLCLVLTREVCRCHSVPVVSSLPTHWSVNPVFLKKVLLKNVTKEFLYIKILLK